MHRRPPFQPALVIFGCAVGATLLLPSAGPEHAGASETAQTATMSPDQSLRVLESDSASTDERVESAALLVVERRFDLLTESLTPEAPIASIRIVAEALAGVRSEDLPDPLLRALGSVLMRTDLPLDARRAVLAVLQRLRTRNAVRPLIESLNAGVGVDSITLTCEALARQTGRIDFGADAAAWRQWWTGVEWLNEAEWRTRLAEAHARRADALGAQRDDLERRWLDAMRRLHGLTPPGERSVLIRDLLVDASPGARRLGLEFVEQALLNARALDPAVSRLAVERIADPDASVRAVAATVAARTSPEAAASVAAAALEVETDPSSAAAQLTLISRRPVAGASQAALFWLNTDGPAGVAAADALLALANAGRVQDPSIRLPVREIARRRLEGPLRPDGAPWARLLIAVGGWDDAALAVTFLPAGAGESPAPTPGRIAEQPSGFGGLQEASGGSLDP